MTMARKGATMASRRGENSKRRHSTMLLFTSRVVSSNASYGAGIDSSLPHSSFQPHHLSFSTTTSAQALSKHQDFNSNHLFSAQARYTNYGHNSTQTQALQVLLRTPIRFVQATQRTLEDEQKMAPQLRLRNVRNESTGQRTHRLLVGELLEIYCALLRPRSQTHQISAKWGRQALRPTKSRGLANPGNLCYQNSLFQSLLHIPKFVNWLEIHHYNCGIEDCLACRFKTFCERYWDEPHREQPIAAAVMALRARIATASGE